MVLKFVEKHGRVKRAEVVELCKISPFQATRLLKRLAEDGKIAPMGKGKGTYYELRS